jgi:hypothetical protein
LPKGKNWVNSILLIIKIMKQINLLSNLLKGLIFFGSFIFIHECSYAQISNVTEREDKIVVRNRQGIEFVVIKKGFRYGFQKTDGKNIVPAHPVSGLLAGDPEKLSQAKTTKYIGAKDSVYSFEVTLENKNAIILRLKLGKETALFQIENPKGEAIAMALRTAGVSPGYGLGDVVANWWNRLPENKGKYNTEISGFANYDYSSSSGDRKSVV